MSLLAALAVALVGASALALVVGRLHVFLHLLQLEHYETSRLRVWVARRHERLDRLGVGVIAIVGAGVVVILAAGLPTAPALVPGLAGFAFALRRTQEVLRRPQTKKLVFTPRATRLMALSVALAAIVLAIVAWLAGAQSAAVGALAVACAGVALEICAPEVLGTANALLRPVQRLDNARFTQRARRQLKRVQPTVIGITGSYGKTTTKGCVAEVASLVGPTLPTPASFNSYLGVVRTINEELQSNHKTFVVEMGAYRRGDVAELCELVEPTIGVLTAIGPAHLERFGSLEVTTLAKAELGESLPVDGLFITRADDPRCREAAKRAACPVHLFSPAFHDDAHFWAEDLKFKDGRTTFTLHLGGEVEGEIAVTSKLLGRHNVANLVASAAVGAHLGLSATQIAQALGRVKPVQHRLSPIVNRRSRLVVIDDAYNSNPDGAAAALEVLADHAGGRKVLVTPGMVELGSDEKEANRNFGTEAAAVCDLVLLVGDSPAGSVREGLEAAGFGSSAIHSVRNSRGAEELLAKETRPGDVILFENDLPDLYDASISKVLPGEQALSEA
ncbi:MAG: UDP-N-acetylmuramoyl-tripeptide--D-alanyl-D-alanine ligase [Actinobacteria bacterium]|nr:UDP-N-acetylmuramoyl-tripeptide--D-alanyl-D-alanine ligase [Actinomycetota bacterium]